MCTSYRHLLRFLISFPFPSFHHLPIPMPITTTRNHQPNNTEHQNTQHDSQCHINRPRLAPHFYRELCRQMAVAELWIKNHSANFVNLIPWDKNDTVLTRRIQNRIRQRLLVFFGRPVKTRGVRGFVPIRGIFEVFPHLWLSLTPNITCFHAVPDVLCFLAVCFCHVQCEVGVDVHDVIISVEEFQFRPESRLSVE